MKLKLCRTVHNITLYKNYVFIAVAHVLLSLWQLIISIDLGKVKVGLYFCLTADILMKVFQKCFLSSPLPNIWILSKLLNLIGCRQDQDQDSLLVKRRNDNHSPGPVIREVVPSSHQRSELSNTIFCIFCIFSGWDQRIGEGIPIPDSLGEEATFINICIGNGSLKCHRVLISTTPSFGDKVICWYTGFTFKTFI